MRFRAAVLRSYESPFALEEVVLATGPAPGEILVEIAGCGMCRTDLAVRRSAGRTPLPAVLGHEGAGVVVAAGDGTGGTGGTEGIGVGDHVVLSFDSCGECRNCRAAAPAHCDSFASLNLFGGRTAQAGRLTDAAGRALAPRWFGQSSFAEYALVPARNAVRVDPALPIALLGPLGCSVLTGAGAVLNTFRAGPGDTLVVLGAGGVGLAAVMAAGAAGVRTVAVDGNPARLALAERFGATPLPAATPRLAERIRRRTDGGARFALDTTASAPLINEALRALRPTGVLGLVARLHTPLALEPGTLDRGRAIRHICEGDAVPGLLIPRLIGLWQAGRLPFDELIRTYPLADIDEAERDCDAGRVVKPVLLPDRGDR
ncbi:NAD(P)-dependent alcohol dehydrogenase [Streptomyces genisteinicus]|uniref:NAD(P)-dependent alcohol dehydrogenase n=1 Tax=Streptomyces genisteinicus TaxID=2768068 RepID=A0A7H0HNF1_9ACTN|nr:NAD(P)-dependent alcohol dehydrogenase [Streptomyces genisteinicus]QNP62067.1 NAD(P)-dependent alcohol dehydrogenase [Streptomyces genisteinicus]